MLFRSFDYIRARVKSVEQLLPAYAYLRDQGQTQLRPYDPLIYPNNYPYNIFLENLNSQTYLDKLSNSGVKILNIIGNNGDNTISVIEVSDGSQYSPLWQHGYAEKNIELAGDGTVPESSSSFLASFKIDNAKHRELPTKAQKEIIHFLKNITPTIEVIDTPEIQKILVIQAYSPIDFQVIAPDGKLIGKNFNDNTEINQIDYAFYSGFQGESEFVLIINPLDGEYAINLQGTDEGGDYRLVVSKIDDQIGQESFIDGTVATGQSQSYSFSYDGQAVEPIVIKPVVKEITIKDIIRDIDSIIASGGFKHKAYGRVLKNQLKLVKRWNNKMNKAERKWKKRIYRRLILKKLRFIKKELKWWLRRKKIDQPSYNILINDINLLINNYK